MSTSTRQIDKRDRTKWSQLNKMHQATYRTFTSWLDQILLYPASTDRVIVDHVDYRRAMGKRDLLNGLRGPAAHWPASLSLSTKQYRRGGNFLLDDVTSLIRLRAGARFDDLCYARFTSRDDVRVFFFFLFFLFFLSLSTSSFLLSSSFFFFLSSSPSPVVLYVRSMSKHVEHVPRICTPCRTRYPAFERLSFDRDTFDSCTSVYTKRVCIIKRTLEWSVCL